MRIIHITSCLAAALCIASAQGQIICDQPGADAAIGLIQTPTNYVNAGSVDAFSLGVTICNVGSVPLGFFGSPSNQHPIMVQNLYRLKTVDGTARFEQIGMSWVFHTIFPISQTLCCTPCQPGDSNHLGVRCSCPEPSSFVGVQSTMGPRWQVNAFTGNFPMPPANPPFSTSVDRRLQAKAADIDPAQNPGAIYYGETHLIAPDEVGSSNVFNNASYQKCVFSGSGSAWNIALTGMLQGGFSAIHAWTAVDPAVVETLIDVPGDGRIILAAKATDLGTGQWRYEYALLNFNSDRGGQSFSVPLAAGVAVANAGFHDVDYHSGDGMNNINIDGTDWPATVSSSSITWSTQDIATNPNANALRWSTLYNFRFDANIAPAPAPGGGDITIGLFKAGDPASVSASTIVPGIPSLRCVADIAPPGPPAGDGTVNVADLLLVINSWGPCAGPCPADIAPTGGDGAVNTSDLLAIINSWGPCP